MAFKTKLITMLLIGSSSVAVAGPMARDHRVSAGVSANVGASANVGVSANVGFGGSVSIRDHRDPFERESPRFPGSRPGPKAMLLASGLHYEATQYRKDIVMTSEQGAFRGLSLQGDRGQTYLMKVVIEFADGDVQRVDLNRTLAAGQSLSIDLDGGFRAIHRVLVYRADGDEALTMNRQHRGDFNVFAF
jgi:hypothetical protein